MPPGVGKQEEFLNDGWTRWGSGWLFQPSWIINDDLGQEILEQVFIKFRFICIDRETGNSKY